MTRRIASILTILAAAVALLMPSTAAGAASVASPAAGSTVAGAVAVLARTGATDDIDHVQLTVDGVRTGESWAAPWGVLWDTRSVPDGAHELRLVTFASTGATTTSAPVKVTVRNGGGGGLAATYFRRGDLTDAALTRTDATVNFTWGRQRPVAELPADGFSVRWAGTVEAPTTDVYTFNVLAEDGVRLTIDQRVLIDEWGHRGRKEHAASVSLTAGKRYAIRLEYLGDKDDAEVRLRWKSFHTGLTTIPQRLLQPSASASARTMGLRATFYTERSIRAKAQLVSRVDPVMRFRWGHGSPDASVPQDNFAVRWSGKFRAPRTGTYQFWTKADDGVRVWVGKQRVVNDWSIHAARTSTGKVKLRKGVVYRLRVDYYEAGGQAELQVDWKRPGGKREVLPTRLLVPDAAPPAPPKPTTGLLGTYYDDAAMTQQVLQRLDNELAFKWEAGSPDPVVGPDTFSARWTGTITPPASGSWKLATEGDDGVRVFVDGELVLADWTTHSARWQEATLELQAGRAYDIEIQYYEGVGGASFKLAWTPPGGKRVTIPTQYMQPHPPLTATPMKPTPPAPPAVPVQGLWGVYFDDEDFGGRMASRVDPNLDFAWKSGRPHPSIGQDTFSVRWTGSLAVPAAADYTFVTDADDGVRVWIDGRLIIDRWTWRSPSIDRSAPVRLETNRRYDVRVEQHDGNGSAGIQLRWSTADMRERVVPAWALMTPGDASPTITMPGAPSGITPPATPVSGLWGTYYDTAEFTDPKFARADATVDFDWGTGRPAPDMDSTLYSMRWLGTVEVPTAGDWRIHVRADDGVRLWVCGQLVVDQWKTQSATEYASPVIRMEPGTRCAVRIDYYQGGGHASMRLSWSSATQAKQVVPATALRTPERATLGPLWWE